VNDSKKIFLVDDNSAVLASMDALLKLEGYSVQCFSNGADFFRQTDLNQVGCVISDLLMPEMNGVDLQRRLCKYDSSLALIIISGHADVSSTVQLMEKGAVTLIQKPLETNRLLAAIEKALLQSQEQHKSLALYRDAVERLSQVDEEELQVMQCTIKGMPVKAISDALTMSNRTVDRRRLSALTKAKATSVTEFAMLLARLQR
jgi:FixJ family two-component response regulator